ncbi:hypothetical protein V8C86DRAFT_2598103 [Haematococcus lacustris]
MTIPVVVSLGSNMGDRGRHLWWAVQQLLACGFKVQRCSGLYETAAAYVTQQPAFLNAALLLTTDAPPRDLLHSLKEVERAAGRQLEAGQRWGPRPLDLDIILYGAACFQDERLQVPHPSQVAGAPLCAPACQ